MKKNYISPSVACVDFAIEGMIATSLEVNTSKRGSGQLSNGMRGGWSSSNWTDGSDTEE